MGYKLKRDKTLDDLNKLTMSQFHQYWFIEGLTDGMMAKEFNTTKEEVKRKRKELHLNWYNSAVLYIAGGPAFRHKNMWINKKDKKDKKK